MARLLCIIFILAFASCSSLRISDQKNTGNTMQMDVELRYGEKIKPNLKPRLDSMILDVMERFDSENHSFSVHLNADGARDSLIVDFSKYRLLSRKQKNTAYVINVFGMVGGVLSLGAGLPPIMINYLPENKLYSTLSLSSELSTRRHAQESLHVRTQSLFAGSNRQTQKLLRKFSARFYKELIKIDQQLKYNDSFAESNYQ